MIIPLKQIQNSSVFLRLDLNVPIQKDDSGSISIKDSTRLIKSLPSIYGLLENQNKIIITSHLGRPKGFKPDLSLLPVFNELSKIISSKFPLAKAVFCRSFEELQNKFLNHDFQILFFENLRFFKEEEENDHEFKQKFKNLAEFYINDAFSCSHRAHASIMLSEKYEESKKAMGLFLETEIQNINKFFDINTDKKKKIAIIGGSKISTKIKLIKSLEKKFDYVFIGGAMANMTSLLLGFEIGLSLKEELPEALEKEIKNLLSSPKIITPDDFVCVKSKIENNSDFFLKDKNMIEKDEIMLDIGSKSIAKLKSLIDECEFVVWNGPLGFFENDHFEKGTKETAKYISLKTQKGEINSIVGGGDSVSSLNKFKIPFDSFSYVSTSGGAFLEYIENDLSLIGLENLLN
jgi:phosphoglycerate kinase